MATAQALLTMHDRYKASARCLILFTRNSSDIMNSCLAPELSGEFKILISPSENLFIIILRKFTDA